MKQLNETVEKSVTPNFPCYTCMVVLQSVTKQCPGVTVHWVYALTQKVHQNKGETQSGEKAGKK